MSEELFMVYDDTNNSANLHDIDPAALPPELLSRLDAAMFPEENTGSAAA